MIHLDETIFDENGLGELSAAEKERMLGYVYKTLETRVGIRLAAEATEEQLQAFKEHAKQGNDQATLEWLAIAFPNFDAVIANELAQIKTELADMARDVLDARR